MNFPAPTRGAVAAPAASAAPQLPRRSCASRVVRVPLALPRAVACGAAGSGPTGSRYPFGTHGLGQTAPTTPSSPGASVGPQPLFAASSVPAPSGDNSAPSSSEPPSQEPLTTAEKLRQFALAVKAFVKAQFLPLGLVSAIVFGWNFPSPGIAAASMGLPKLATSAIFVLSGLNLKRGEAMQALKCWPAVLFGMISILCITPAASLLTERLTLSPPDLVLGLSVFCCMPTTLSSGVALTSVAKANTALALLLTLTTNILGVATIPLMVGFFVSGTNASLAAFNTAELMVNLFQTILVPLGCGVAARSMIDPLRAWVDENKSRLGLLQSACLITIPWSQISSATQQNITLDAANLGVAGLAGLAVHLSYIAFNWTASNLLNLGGSGPAGDRIKRAIIIVASQKTLPVAVTVLVQLESLIPGSSIGMAVLPCIMTHFGQILVDSFLVSHWTNSDKAAAEKEATA